MQLLVTRRWHEVGKLPDRDRLLWLIRTYYLVVCVCVCARARACVCMFVFVCARVRVYMCVCIYICMYACIRMYVYIHTYIHTYKLHLLALRRWSEVGGGRVRDRRAEEEVLLCGPILRRY